MKLNFTTILLIFFTLCGYPQEYEEDTDSKSFFSLHAGLNGTRVISEDDTFSNSKREIGYLIGIQYNIFPDYEYSNAYFRIGLEYSSEKSESGDPFIIQNEQVLVSSEFNLLELHFLGGYRFNTDKAVDVYMGGGIFGQYAINNPDEQYLVTKENGETYPLFDNDDNDLPFRYSIDAPRANLGIILELGSFFDIGSKLASASIGYKHAFILGTSGNLSFDKNNFYLKLGYEVF
ncbi:MAG: hypothetical protein ACSHW7_11790 [Patiriisocius sp.]|uniref:hypothetical protein n=1 Tax=Patiriisocius sp. TaxID=2822396 RepID=UPI003EF77FC2